jgi:osmotically inducible protein OsmC
MTRNAKAIWEGGLKDGHGKISSASGVLHETQYSFSTRFENGIGTNPEELIAAAHAGCFAMAFSAQLGELGLKADRIEASADVTLDKTESGFAITKSHLTVSAKIPQATQEQFDKAVNNAKTGCPISKVLNAEITLDATLEG